MNDPDPVNATPDVTPIHRLVRATLRLLRTSWAATGMGLTIGLFLGVLVTSAMLDLVAPLWVAFRVTALVLVVVPASWAFVVGVVRPLMRRMKPNQVARRIEREIPGIHSRLVSCIDLEESARTTATGTGDGRPRRSPEFFRRLVAEALERIKGFRPRQVVDGRSLKRALAFAAVSVSAFALAFGLFSDRLPTALARIFRPLADIPPVSGVLYQVEPGDAEMLRGEDLTFVARVEKGLPERLRLEIRGDNASEPLWYDLEKTKDDRWEFTLAGVGIDDKNGPIARSFEYRVHGGGTWSKKHRVAIVDRPSIVGLHTVLHYPEYMATPEPRVGPPQTGDVTGPEGSTVEVVVQAEGDVAKGEIQFLKSRTKRIEVGESARPERVWFQERTPEGAALEGRWDWDFKLLARRAHTEPPADGVHGHLFHNASTPFQVRRGEILYAMVYIKPGRKPETIMLQWHDGADWEHRAYWGEDKIPYGQPNTPGRRHMGPIPEKLGEWVRLEVPAALVNLDGRSVRGMAFTLFGGECVWHRAGALPRAFLEEQELVVEGSRPMGPAEQGRWSGKFPLERDGLYRVQLKNKLGYANKLMTQAKVVALPDNPPQVALERPGTDLTLSEPGRVPLVIAAHDDFGLAEIVIASRKGDEGGFVGLPIKRFAKPQRSETVVTVLDLAAMGLKTGEHLRYRVEARDRKGQSAQTKEYTIRIAPDPNSADKQLTNFDQTQDHFRENLAKLIAEQAKVQEQVKAMKAKYEPVSEKVKAAQAEAQTQADAEAAKPAESKPGEPIKPKPLDLDPETARKLAELRQELAAVAAKEDQNANLGNQVSEELKNAAEQAANLQMVPPQVSREMKAAQQAFKDLAADPLKDLAGEMKQGAAPDQAPPDLARMKREADRLQQELEAMKERLAAMEKARKGLRDDSAAALADLKNDMARQDADLNARDLKELLEFLKDRGAELHRLEGQEQELADATPVVPERMLSDLEKQQRELEAEAEKPLADAEELLGSDQLKGMRKKRDPNFPDAAAAPDEADELLPPKEEDPDEPLAKDANKKKDADAEQDEEDPLFMPALGGPKPKLDPRFKDKMRPLSKDEQAKGAAHQRREELASRERRKLQEIDMARQSLESDQHALEQMLAQLKKAAEAGDQEAAQMLNDLLKSKGLQDAQAMASRMQQARSGKPRPGQSQQAHAGRPHPSSHPGPGRSNQRAELTAVSAEAVLGELDLESRRIVLKMQPRLREELLQGLREEGPEGYRKFIREYFGKLTKVKAPQ